MPGKNVLEDHSGLQPSEKELPEQRSGAFHHKNTPHHNIYTLYIAYRKPALALHDSLAQPWS
jgi:hypothetical protein